MRNNLFNPLFSITDICIELTIWVASQFSSNITSSSTSWRTMVTSKLQGQLQVGELMVVHQQVVRLLLMWNLWRIWGL